MKLEKSKDEILKFRISHELHEFVQSYADEHSTDKSKIMRSLLEGLKSGEVVL